MDTVNKPINKMKSYKNINYQYFVLLIFSFTIVLLQKSTLPLLSLLTFTFLGIQTSNKRLLGVNLILLILVILAEQKSISFSYSFWMLLLYFLTPLILGFLLRKKIKSTTYMYYGFLHIVIPIILSIYLEDVYNRYLTQFVFIQILHILYLYGVGKYIKQYLLIFTILLTLLFANALVGSIKSVLFTSAINMVTFYLGNYIILFFIYKFMNKRNRKKSKYAYYFLQLLLISSLISYLAISYNQRKSIKSNKKIVLYSNSIEKIKLYNQNENIEVNLRTDDTITLNTWATWCFPCIVKLRKLSKQTDKTYKNEYFISFEDSTKIFDFVKNKEYKEMPIFYADEKSLNLISDDLNVFPSTLKFTKDSIIIHKGK